MRAMWIVRVGGDGDEDPSFSVHHCHILLLHIGHFSPQPIYYYQGG